MRAQSYSGLGLVSSSRGTARCTPAHRCRILHRKEPTVRKAFLFAFLLSSFAVSSQNPAHFDGPWNTTVTCDAAGGTRGYTWSFVSTVSSSVLHGEHGRQAEPPYLAIDGKIGKDGSAKLIASGITGAAEYTHGPFKAEGAQYSYDVKAKFTDKEGKGERSTGLGIIGRPCHYEFQKQPGAPAPQ